MRASHDWFWFYFRLHGWEIGAVSLLFTNLVANTTQFLLMIMIHLLDFFKKVASTPEVYARKKWNLLRGDDSMH